MSVRHSLLAILTQGPCYGYQLRSEFDRRTGGTSPLNVGQVYNTLERLERDMLVRREDADEQGQVFWFITTRGEAEVTAWVRTPTQRTSGARDDLAIKIAVLATLPHLDAHDALTVQRTDAERRTAMLGEQRSASGHLSASIVLNAAVAQARAEIAWIDETIALLAGADPAAVHMGLVRERPKRGRPARASGVSTSV